MCASLCAAMRENGPARQEEVRHRSGPSSCKAAAGTEPPARAGPCGRPGRATLTRPDPVGGRSPGWWDPLSDNGAGPTRKFYGSRPDLSGLIHVDDFAQ